MGFCSTCHRLMVWDSASGKLKCKNDNCGNPKQISDLNNEKSVQNRAQGKQSDLGPISELDDFLETIMRNYQKEVFHQNKRFKLGDHPIYEIDTVNYYNEKTGLYLTATRWNLPKAKYIDLPGDALTGIEIYHKKTLTFFLAETPHDQSNYEKFDKQFCLQRVR